MESKPGPKVPSSGRAVLEALGKKCSLPQSSMCVGPYHNKAAVGRLSCGQSGTLHSRQLYAKQLSILRKHLSVMPPECHCVHLQQGVSLPILFTV